jgi:hypothetical protein
MANDIDPLDDEPGLTPERRAFLKKVAVGAFVVPVVTSFSMTGLSVGTAAATASNISVGFRDPGADAPTGP